MAIAGVPAAGKTTLVRQALAARQLQDPWRAAKAGLVLYHPWANARFAVLGDYSRPGDFAGTDRLSMAVAPQALEFLAAMRISSWHDWTVLWEGDRLTGRSFLASVGRLSDLRLVILEASVEQLAARQAERGNKQTARFLAGRRTKVEGLKTMPHVLLQSGEGSPALSALLDLLRST